jgi:serine/threonine protein kinase
MFMTSLGFSGHPRFRIIRSVGEGAGGYVFEAEDLEKHERIALKTLRQHDSQALFLLKQEFRALSDIHHPNLVLLHDLFVDADEPFFTMEFVDGLNFREFCAREPREETMDFAAETIVDTELSLACDLGRLRRILFQLSDGLHALHRRGLLHRDIKPSNVNITQDGKVKILDFGLVVGMRTIQDETQLGHTVGTGNYMSPEQGMGEVDLTPASDWYSVGAMLFETLTGQAPFEGPTMKVIMDKQKIDAPAPRELVPEVPEDLNALCIALLNRTADQRPSGSEIVKRTRYASPSDKKNIIVASKTDTVPFTGRVREMTALRQAFDSVRDKGACAVLIRGPSGIGKTRLIQECFHRIEHKDPNLVFLAGRCYEREIVQYRAMDGVIDKLSRYWRKLPELQAGALLPRDAGRLSQLFPVLGRVPAIAGEPEPMAHEDPEIRRTRGYAAVRETLQRLGAHSRLVVFLDDMQWMDKDSVNLLTDILRPPDPPQMLLVLCSRDYPEEELPILHGLIKELTPTLEVHEIGPLPKADCEDLARLLSGSGEAEQISRLTAECEGNPFLLSELARYVRSEEGAAAQSLRLEDVFSRRLATLNPDARLLLEFACIAGEPLSVAVARHAVKLKPENLSENLRMLNANRLIRSAGGKKEDHFEPYHSRIQEIVVSTLSTSRLAELHRDVAVALGAAGEASDEALARHWSGAGEANRAANHAKLAGDKAMTSTDFEAASAWYRVAVEQGSHTADESRRLRTLLGEALGFAGQPLDAAAAFERAAENADRSRALELRRRSMEQLLGGGYVADGLDAARNLLADVGLSLPKSTGATLWRVIWNQVYNRIRGLKWTPRAEAEISADAMAQAQIALTVGTTLSNVDTLRANAVLGCGLRLALNLGVPSVVVQATSVASCLASALNQKERAKALLEVAEQAARLDGSLHSKGLVKAAREFLAFFVENEWRNTTRLGDEVLELFWATGQGRIWERDVCLLYRCFGRMYLGELVQLSEEVSEFFQSAARSGNRLLDVSLRTGFRIRHLANDNPDAARKDIREALEAWLSPDVAFLVQHWYALWGRVEVALYKGDVEEAEADLEENQLRFEKSLLTHVGRLRCEYRHLLGRVALARGALAQDKTGRTRAIKSAHKMAKILRKQKLPIGDTFALLLECGAINLEDKHEQTIDLLKKTITRLEETETLLYAAAARRQLGVLLGGEEGNMLVEAADAWMAGQGVMRPDRMTAMLVPGWTYPGPDLV